MSKRFVRRPYKTSLATVGAASARIHWYHQSGVKPAVAEIRIMADVPTSPTNDAIPPTILADLVKAAESIKSS